jgi:uncharacterized protein YodC (DUF2158 family)
MSEGRHAKLDIVDVLRLKEGGPKNLSSSSALSVRTAREKYV